MRHGIAVVCLMAAACTSETELRYTATLQAETNGLALSDDGLDSFAAMAGTTCIIDTQWGCPTADADLPTREERLVDSYDGHVLATTAEGLHTLDHDGWRRTDDLQFSGLRTASLVRDGGRLMVAADDVGCWLHGAESAAIAVPDEACEDGVIYTTDRASAVMYASTRTGVLQLSRAGGAPLANAGDLVSWDPLLELLYTANRGTSQLFALDRSGAEVWKVQTRGPISSIATRGGRGEVLDLIERSDGFGGVERRDGRTGELLGSSLIPEGDGDIISSGNGWTIGVVRAEEVNFFGLEPRGEDPVEVIDADPPTCIDPFDGQASE